MIKGISLLELLFTLTITSIITCFALSHFRVLLNTYQADFTMDQLSVILRFAQQASYSHQQNIIICPSLDEQHCQSNWNAPIMIFLDRFNDKTIHSKTQILRIFADMNKGILQFKGFPSNRYLKINPHYHSNGTFQYQDVNQDPRYTRRLIINRSGRIRRLKIG